METNPKVTILMPVYNGEIYLKEAIESILNQTFKDFELLIINDCSSDSSKEVIEVFDDPRIKYIENEINIGLSNSLNKGVELAEGEYIARMDQDDISLPARLEKQVEFLDNNLDYGICGTLIENFGAKEGIENYPTENDLIKIHLLFYSPIAHPTVMFRKSMLEKYDLKYNPEYEYGEDYDLWSKCAKYFKIVNLDKVLLKYRVHQTGMSQSSKERQDTLSSQIRKNQLSQLGIEASGEELSLHHSLICNAFENSNDYLNKAEKWILKLVIANKHHKIYDVKLFNELLGKFWFEIIKLKVNTGIKCWQRYNNSKLRKYIYKAKNSRKIFTRALIWQMKNKF